jgi:hypothetical protein
MQKYKKIGKAFLVIAENAPTLLTVFIGAYVVIKNQQVPYEVSKLLDWTITILCLIASSMLIERFIRLKNIEKNVIEINEFMKLKEGKASLDEILITRKDLQPLEERLKYTKDVKISGASLFRLTTEYMNLFEDKANEGCMFKFLLLNPDCEATKLVATNIVYEINDITMYISNINNTINNLKQLQKKYPKNIEIKTVDFLPAYSLIITDSQKESGVVRLELYTQLIPTRNRPQMVLNKNREPKWCDFFVNQFDIMWNNPNSNTI